MSSPVETRPVPFWRAPFSGRTWAETLYALLGLPLCIVGFSWTVTSLAIGLSMTITVIGVWVLVAALITARWSGVVDRSLLNSLLRERIEAPRARPRRPGTMGWLEAQLGDPVAWRAIAYQVLRFPLALVTFVVTVTFWTLPLGAVTYPLWRGFLPAQRGSDGLMHRGDAFAYSSGHEYFIDTRSRILAQAAVGFVFIWLSPWIVRGFVALHRKLGRALLGPVSISQRVRDLEASRTQAVVSSNEQLRKIERDLHDGTQARLVALAMHLGQAKEDLDSDDPAAAERAKILIAGAHEQTKETLTELRDLARGIHPPILDDGLESALTSLGARSPIRVGLDIDLPRRPSPSTETIAYFAIAELLTNTIKHSQAREITVDLRVTGKLLTFRVADNGRGGAVLGGGSGLAGVTARLGTVDGRLLIDSPLGGPTTITGVLPMDA